MTELRSSINELDIDIFAQPSAEVDKQGLHEGHEIDTRHWFLKVENVPCAM